MSTNTTTIRFHKDKQKLLDLYMEFQSHSLSTVLKDALFEGIYDFFDSVISEEAIKYSEENPQKYTSSEIMEALGLIEDDMEFNIR